MYHFFFFPTGARQESHGWNDGSKGHFQAGVRDSREDCQEQAAYVSFGESVQHKPVESHRCG